ncbi:MAG: 30S ribosomal protein S17 [Woeseia sp.]|uniref:Small ribosomal subunit protein uS17 n=1 Tax=Woeseia oceani TaxID=1548547 RepID=A0A193LDN3_9GAMM|nr:30S ribosomal protein S17 [Woeseia oceani]ANO50640.1 30S ribosomal protein S17 [Woeseia oceani]
MSEAAKPADAKIKRTVTGRVVSNKMDKTVSVYIERVIKHETYGKYIRRSSKVLAHDESNDCNEGDRVAISECRPMSKRKAWQVVNIIERAVQDK